MRATIAASITDRFFGSPCSDPLPNSIQWLEIRSDLTGDLATDRVRRRFEGTTIYCLRSAEMGGSFDGTREERCDRLLRAANHYDLVDLEAPADLDQHLLDRIPPEKRIVSWSGVFTSRAALQFTLARMLQVEARLYRITPRVARTAHAIEVLSFLAAAGRPDLVAFAIGRSWFWTRLIAPHLGAPIVFGTPSETFGELGEPPASRLADDYGFPDLLRPTHIFGIVGNPAFHSLSPRIHNSGYRWSGSPGLFVPFETGSFEEIWRELVESQALADLGICVGGLTVASPFKEAALGFATRLSAAVEESGSTNLLVRSGDDWVAETTDPDGILDCLRDAGVDPREHHAAVIGCGGAGRPIALALHEAGARVTLINRGLERGLLARRLLGLPFVPLSSFSPAPYSLIVNATPVGRNDGQAPFELGGLKPGTVVVDLVYGSAVTPLIEAARASGCIAIDGRRILLAEVLCQFRQMVGAAMPRHLAESILGFDQPRLEQTPASPPVVLAAAGGES